MPNRFDGLVDPEEIERVIRRLGGDLERREFLKKMGRLAGGVLLGASLGAVAASCGGRTPTVTRTSAPATSPPPQPAPAADLAVATTGTPAEMTRKALDAIGGMSRFVQAGNVVVVKPNASFMDGLEGGTSTNPDVVAEVIKMCREAGAARVLLVDHTLRGAAEACLNANGIGAAARAAGAELLVRGGSDQGGGVTTPIPNAVAMTSADVYPEVLAADVVITVPKAKHHGSAGLSLGLKNFIGVTSNMSEIHNHGLQQSIADLATLVRPKLSVVDATVILLENGPGGPGATRAANTVIASGDVVAADSYACTLFGMTAADVPYIVHAAEAGLGTTDFNALKVASV
ncbi:MAG: DUF362 domain-containing protein [Actinomycetota bacterium]